MVLLVERTGRILIPVACGRYVPVSGVVDVDEHCGVCELCCPLNGLAVGLALSLAHVQAGTHVLNRVANLSAFGYFGGFDLPDEARVVLVERFPTNKVRFVELGRVHCIVAVLHFNESVVGGEEVVVAAVLELYLASAALEPGVKLCELFVDIHGFVVAHVADLIVCLHPKVVELLEFLCVGHIARVGAHLVSVLPVVRHVVKELHKVVASGGELRVTAHGPDVRVGPLPEGRYAFV